MLSMDLDINHEPHQYIRLWKVNELSNPGFTHHDDVMTWRCLTFPRYCTGPFVRGIHRSPVDSSHKGPVTLALMFFFDVSPKTLLYTVELPVIWNAITLLWRQCDDVASSRYHPGIIYFVTSSARDRAMAIILPDGNKKLPELLWAHHAYQYHEYGPVILTWGQYSRKCCVVFICGQFPWKCSVALPCGQFRKQCWRHRSATYHNTGHFVSILN